MTGYDVQSTVILELVLRGFAELPANVELRPEGQDDLELRWVDPASSQFRRRYHQIKKATDNDPVATWSLPEVARVLLGRAVAKLQGNLDEQVWVLGDRLAADVEQLIHAGHEAPDRQRTAYLTALHRLAKAESCMTEGLKDTRLKRQLDRWNPTSQNDTIDQDVEQTTNAFVELAAGVSQIRLDDYRQQVSALHAILPDVLARITARSYHGTEHQISTRVRTLLVDRYKLDPVAVQDVIFRNLRGFINDVSKEPGRTITQEEFETELVQVWPWLVVPTQPRILDADHLARPELVRAIVMPAPAREVVGPSGSGKSSLASEVYAALSHERRDAVVLFVEVRTMTMLRDVLVGVAYSLHRRGFGQVIGPALHLRASDTTTIERVAAVLGAVPREIYLLIDCADSEVSSGFRRDLAVFTRALRGTRLRIIGFAQMSMFRELTPVERSALAIVQEPMPGLNFGQFLSLLVRRHPKLERAAAYTLFEQLSAGLPTGVLPNLAQQLAHARSLAEMQEIVRRPPDQRLSAAHLDRFESVPAALQQAASRISCLSLPLAASQIIALFPHEPMQRALLALVEQGLLAPFADRVEMHETVRAGLERLVPPELANRTHDALAHYFAQRDLLPAQIYHLEKAGRGEEARHLARQRFLSGRDWRDLVEYIGAKQCVSADEVLSLLLDDGKNERYLLRDLLPRIQDSETAQRLLDSLRSNPERYREDSKRTLLLQETLLKCDPGMLTPLTVFTLAQADLDKDLFECLLTSAWRARTAPDALFMAWFRSQGLEVRKKAVGLLLLRPDLLRLKEALTFMHRHRLPIAARGSNRFGSPILDLTTDEELEYFLEALPQAEPASTLASRSVLLAPFESFVWHERVALRRVGRALVQQGSAATPVLANAIRVLIFLNDRDVVSLARRYRSGSDAVASLAWMAPIILDAEEELPELEAVALAPGSTSEARAVAIAIATQLGADPENLLARAAAVEPDEHHGLETSLLLQATFLPFPRAVQVLSTTLEASSEHHEIFGGLLVRLAESGFAGTDTLLVNAMRISNSGLVAHALVAAGRSRFHGSLMPILHIARNAEMPETRALAIHAALATGPDSTDLFRNLWQHNPAVAHWRWLLAGRLRDAGEASALVALATDATQDWKVRRLAILAAGRLPFSVAMAAIVPVILATTLFLTEESPRLQTHALMALLVETVGWRGLLPTFRQGRDCFVQAVAPIYEGQTRDANGLMPAVDAVGWLWDRLDRHDFARDPGALENVVNELHVPMLHAAVLLVLRRHGRRDDLLLALERAATHWLLIRAIQELCRGEHLSVEHEQRAQALVNSAPTAVRIFLERIFDSRPRRERATSLPRAEGTPMPTQALRLTFEQAQAYRISTRPVDTNPIVVELDERELRALVVELDPASDTEWRAARDAKPARVSLSETSWRLRGGPALEQTSPHCEQRAALRPAVAAANRFGIDIPWHRAELGALRSLYADRFFASLGTQGDPDAFVRIVTVDAEFLVPLLDDPKRVTHVLPLVDERLLPVLDRFIQAGNGVFFQQLCTLICRVDTAPVRRSLAKAFGRWLVLLEQLQAGPEHANIETPEWRVVWQTLSLLRKHVYFDSIPQARYRLLDVLIRHHHLQHWHRERILELLRDWPPAYLQFEIEVFRHADFEHYRENKVETYDDIADALFLKVR
jgi:hypothetical protein